MLNLSLTMFPFLLHNGQRCGLFWVFEYASYRFTISLGVLGILYLLG